MKKNIKLKTLRMLYNLKQSDLAKILNIKNVTYTNKENGKYQFTDKEKLTIKEYFKNLGSDLTIDELFF